MVIVAAAVLVTSSIFFLSRGRKRTGRGTRRLHELTGVPIREISERAGLPAVLRLICLAVGRSIPPRILRALSRDLEACSRSSGIAVEQLLGMRVLCGALLPFTALAATRFSPLGAVIAVPAGLVGAMSPRILASRRNAFYLDAVREELPGTADMLYAFVLGGRNLDSAYRHAAETARDPLGALLLRSVREIELGSSRAAAFDNVLARCPLPELATLLRSLTEAERRGHPLSDTLEVFSRELRLRRRDQLRVKVAKAPLKMLAPLIFLILPASIILTVGPTFLTTLSRGLSGF